ncbi:urease accessory protein [Salipiger thiooxidans]|uniref:Urease accessory protein n=1 Tax=Salipiger thiooxidans TaxID=282683 RepID=A0A1G7BN51_9RHOB|nr:urease accessory protein UreE [Salipiger thiooxidans]SDE27866.1 urease accessory protein [Salipiger thiooxidans]
MIGSPLPKEPLQVTALLGNARSDRHDAVHALEHEGRVEVIDIARADAARTDKVREVQIALLRDQSLEDGAVLHLDNTLAIVLRVDSGARLTLVPHDLQSALRLGHWCGNLHWKVSFAEGVMSVPLDGPEARYRARLRDLEGLASSHIAEPDK